MKNLAVVTKKLDESILMKLNNEEKRIIIASKHFIPFKDYDNEAKQKLAQLLIELSYFVGIKEPQSAESLKMLVKFLCSQFPMMTKEELHEAINMTCGGKFGDIEHYQSFSPIYLGKVINAYTKHSVEAKKKYQQLENQKISDLKTQEKEQAYNRYRGAYEVLVKEFKEFVELKREMVKDEYVKDEDRLGIKEFSLKICYEMLKRIKFFTDEKIVENNDDGIKIMQSYFLSLPTNYKEALEKLKQDMYVCSNGNNQVNNS